jgi:hypothetical protein
MEEIIRIRLQPLPRSIEDGGFHAPHKHYVEHGIVRDENIWRVVLHVPAGPHFTSAETWKEPSCRPAGYKLSITFSAY